MTAISTSSPRVRAFPDRAAMGRAAADDVAASLRALLAVQPRVRMVFAAAPSQQELLDALVEAPEVDWSRVTAFHMDEYLDLPTGAPQRFARWLCDAFFDRVPLGLVHLIEPGPDAERTARDYAEALAAAPIDLVCLGIGVNGHLAFNDPPVADLTDPADVKVVQLDEVCRQQQVDDDCFDTLAEVPHRAITLTVPRLLAAGKLFCVVPGERKSAAVRHALLDPVGAECPATALRTHPDCTLYLDREAAALLPDGVGRAD